MSTPNTNILDLIRGYHPRIAEAAIATQAANEAANEASRAATVARLELEQLKKELAVLVKVALDHGIDPPELSPSDLPQEAEDWRSLNRLDAVERVVREAAVPVHINEIVDVLQSHGREEDSYQLVSASLANLKARRGTVIPVGQGKWTFNASGTNPAGHPSYPV
jgi:hypothetical protein